MVPKYRRGWYVTHATTGQSGKIIDVIKTPKGYEYTLQLGNYSRITYHESALIRNGAQRSR